MVYNRSKALKLNRLAQGIAGRMEERRRKLDEEYRSQMPPPNTKKWHLSEYESPPPETIKLPRRLVEALISDMAQWEKHLLDHSEPSTK